MAPHPFHDDSGFPRALLRLRDVVRRRGGDVTAESSGWIAQGGGSEWRMSHPQGIAVRVGFFADGYTGVLATEHAMVENSPETSYATDSSGRTVLERLVLGVIDGGYSETVSYDEQGTWVRGDCEIAGESVHDVGFRENPQPTGPVVRTENVRLPAWPEASGPG